MKPYDLIVVFSICGIGGRSNIANYALHIAALLFQKGVDFRMVISSCQNDRADLLELESVFTNKLSWYITQECHPVNITFNHACLCAKQEFGMPSHGFLYVDSGCKIAASQYQLDQLIKNHTSGPYAMTAGLVDKDSGFDLWRPGLSEDQLFTGDVYNIPVGQTANLHFQIFDKSLVEAYGRPMPDVFRDFCTESIFSFMCASVRKGFGVWRNVRIRHDHGMDGGASGFQDDRGWRSFLPQASRSAESIVADPEAKACGMGYEECEGILMHDPGCYDNNGIPKDPARLQRFIAQNFFLSKTRFAYDKIEHLWVPEGKELAMYTLPPEPKLPNLQNLKSQNHMKDWMQSEGLSDNFVSVNGSPTTPNPENFEKRSLDGVFLNGDKDYKALGEAIDVWWHKIKRGGIIAGADYHNKASKPNFKDDRNAVERWFSERNVVYRVLDDGTWIATKRW